MSTDLWRLLARHWPLRLPRGRLAAVVDGHVIEAALQAGVLVATPLEAGDAYPCMACAEAGCAMRVIRDGPEIGLSAVCELAPAQCLDERIADDDAWMLRIEPNTFASQLGAALNVEGVRKAFRGSAPLLLGVRVFGRERVPVVLVPHPRVSAEMLRGLGVCDYRVVIAIGLGAIDGNTPRRVDDTRVEWVRLEDIVAIRGDRLVGDLTEVAVRHRFDGFDLVDALGGQFDLVLHPAANTYAWRGRRLALKPRDQAAELLHLLAETPDEPVAKRHIAGVLWPDDVRGKLRNPRPGVDIEARLRQAKETLQNLLGRDEEPIENGRGYGSGMRLRVPASRVRWLSPAPPPELE